MHGRMRYSKGLLKRMHAHNMASQATCMDTRMLLLAAIAIKHTFHATAGLVPTQRGHRIQVVVKFRGM